MKNKITFMIMMILCVMQISYAAEELELVGSDVRFDKAYSQYTINNIYNRTLNSTDLNTIAAGFVSRSGQIVDYWLERQVNITYQRTVYGYDEIYTEYDCYNNDTQQNMTCVEYVNSIVNNTTYQYHQLEWVQILNFDNLSLPDGMSFDFRINADILPVNGRYQIDNIPEFKGKQYVEYTWWNLSYDVKRNVTNITTTDIAVAINGTNGFYGKTIWVNPSQCGATGTIAIYYEIANTSNYAVACNDTTEMNYDTEDRFGNDYDNNPTSVYNSGNIGNWHLNDTTDSSVIAQANFTANNDAVVVSGRYGGGYFLDGEDDHLALGTNAAYPSAEGTMILFASSVSQADYSPYIAEFYKDTSNRGAFVQDWLPTTSSLTMYLNIKTAGSWGTALSASRSNHEFEGWDMFAWRFSDNVPDGRKIYYNGTLNNSNVDANDFDFDGSWFLGCAGNTLTGTAAHFNGTIDEFRYYDITLSDSQISEVYYNSINVNMQLDSAELFNTPPTITVVQIPNNTVDTDIDVNLTFNLTDDNNDTLNLTIYYCNGTEIVSDTGITPPSQETYNMSDLAYNTTYCWLANVTDGISIVSTGKYYFTTIELSSELDIIFDGADSGIGVNFDIDEDISIYLNLTDQNQTSINDSECNITMSYTYVEYEAADDNFTLCASVLCDYDTSYEDNITVHSTLNVINDTVHAEVCHENLQLEDLILNISCNNGAISDGDIISASSFPSCDDGIAFVSFETGVCTNYTELNITATNSGAYPQRHRITEFSADRQYIDHLNEWNVSVFYNATSGLYYVNHIHEYYDAGIYNITAICENDITEYDNEVIENITIVNVAPTIIFGDVVTNETLQTLTNNSAIETYYGDYIFFVTIFDTNLEYSLLNMSYSNGTVFFTENSSDGINISMTETFFIDYDSQNKNPYKIDVFANDSDGLNSTDVLYFNMTDTQDPTCTGTTNFTIDSGDNQSISITCNDSRIVTVNMTCLDNTTITNHTTDILLPTFTLSHQFLNVTSDFNCTVTVCDGHNDELNCINETFIISVDEDTVITGDLTVGSCPDTTPLAMIFISIIIVAVILIISGLVFGLYIMTFFGAFILLPVSWFLAGCSGLIALMIALFAIVMIGLSMMYPMVK